MARSTVTPIVKCKFQSVHCQTAAPQGKLQQYNLTAPWRLAREANFAASWRPARQDRTVALKFQNNEYCDSNPEAITERRGSLKPPRHRAWRSRAYLVTSSEPNWVAAFAAPHRMACAANFAAPSRLAEQDCTAALKFQNNQYRGWDPEAIIERRGSFKLPRHRAWRGSFKLSRRWIMALGSEPRYWLFWNLSAAVRPCRAIEPGV
jgi:hypothetical protein